MTTNCLTNEAQPKMDFAEIYHYLCKSMINSANSQHNFNVRTKEGVVAKKGGFSFILDLNHETGSPYLPIPGNRTYYPHLAGAELIWQLMGTQDAKFILKHGGKMWNKFVDKKKRVENAYGHRWRKHFGRDQIRDLCAAIRQDSSSRQMVVNAWDSSCDGLTNVGTVANVPCPTTFTINVVDNKIHMSLFIRSSDIVLGLPYDVMCYSLLLAAITEFAGGMFGIGSLHVTLANAHYYDVHSSVINDAVDGRRLSKPQIPLTARWLDLGKKSGDEARKSIAAIEAPFTEEQAEQYLERFKKYYPAIVHHPYSPELEVIS